jgi:hypothetical protein
VDQQVFETRWVHAFEEDSAGGEVYRPETEDIPLSRRPRRRIALSPDGSARIGVPGPADRPVEMDATWNREGDEFVIRTKASGGRREEVLRVSVQSPTRLLVRAGP